MTVKNIDECVGNNLTGISQIVETQSEIRPDLNEAIKFLNTLAGGENEVFVFQTFDDNQLKGAKKRHELIRVLTGTFAEHAEMLTELNQHGAGIFVQVNIADGKGRAADNITALRGLFIDKDDGEIGEMKFRPSILVQSKNGQHAYWKLIPGEPLEKFSTTQKSLIKHFKSDKCVHNLDRVMRLPGFFHLKDPGNPYMVTVREINEVCFRADDILLAYPTNKETQNVRSARKVKAEPNENKKINNFKNWVGRQSVEEGGRNATIVKIVREGLGHNFDAIKLGEIVEDYCERSGLPTEEGAEILGRHIADHEIKQFQPYQNFNAKYEVICGKIHHNKSSPDGVTAIPLCNFEAKIVKEEIHDDGADTKSFFQIDGITADGRLLPKVSVSAEEFSSLNWITAKWGQRAYAYARAGEHLRVAILELSGAAEQLAIYKHTGWRKINDRYLYLHGNGAIGASGPDTSVQVDLKSGRLSDYTLEIPPLNSNELTRAIRASLSLLDVVPKHISFALLASVYRSVLVECHSVDYSIFVSGPTGCFKSSVIGVVQAHFGSQFKFGHLPDNWTSTENALEKKAFLLKDCIFTIDEWTANGTNAEADRLRSKAERILRSQGNQAGRGRMNSNCEMRTEYYPRGIIISTGEDMPPGQSLRARSLQIEMSHGDVNKERLSRLQGNAADGLLGQSTAAYIQWLAAQMEKLKKRIPKLQNRLRDSIRKDGMHHRTPDTVASLLIGLRMYLKFAVHAGALSKVERVELWREGVNALLKLAEKQASHHDNEDQVSKFVNYVRYALNMGEAYIADIKNGNAVDCFGSRSFNCQKIGWMGENEILLDPDASFALVQRLARIQNETILINKNTLWKRLAQKGLILTSDTEKRNVVKKTVEGRRSYVLVFENKDLFFEEVERAKSWSELSQSIQSISGEAS